MPPYKPGGHSQGLRRTLNVAADPDQREKVEREAAKRKDLRWENSKLSDVVRDAIDFYFSDDMDHAEALLEESLEFLNDSPAGPALARKIQSFLAR
jgi:predicted NAD-dependent protein-ADP-ribosyltransferase YbiA (DUF1768 family)